LVDRVFKAGRRLRVTVLLDAAEYQDVAGHSPSTAITDTGGRADVAHRQAGSAARPNSTLAFIGARSAQSAGRWLRSEIAKSPVGAPNHAVGEPIESPNANEPTGQFRVVLNRLFPS
jgi:hypothetical protein